MWDEMCCLFMFLGGEDFDFFCVWLEGRTLGAMGDVRCTIFSALRVLPSASVNELIEA